MTDLWELDLSDASAALASEEISPVEYASALLGRIAQLDPLLDSFIEVTHEIALEDARRAEREILAGNWRGPMHGVPYALKDVIDYEGIRTTAHSKILADSVASGDADVTRALKNAGAVFLGKNACHEFAIGGPSFDLPWPPARNPWDRDRHPGSSSTGSGAAVAAGFVPAAIGTDTGGSIRNPAASSSLVGMKPTHGLVSARGVFPLSPTMDAVGPLTRTVRDNAIVMNAITSGDAPDFTRDLGRELAGVRVGYVRQYHEVDFDDVAPVVVDALDSAVAVLESLGAGVELVAMPPLQEVAGVHSVIMHYEGFAIHRRWLDECPEDYGAISRRRLDSGRAITIDQYEAAMAKRREHLRAFERLTASCDVLVCASSMDPPPLLEDPEEVGQTMRRSARRPFSVLGNPALGVPIGFTAQGLPIGMQLAGADRAEALLYRVGYAYEQATQHHLRRPPPGFVLAATS